MKITALIILCSFFFFCMKSDAQEVDRIIQKGNELYKQKQYDQAEAAYNEALLKDKNNTTAAFNRGIALFRQSKQDDAAKVMDEVIMNSNGNELKGKAYYNKGVILTGQQKLEESIEAYKNALRQNPADKEARENLQKALLELKKKTPPPPPKQNKNNKKQQQPQQPKMNQKEAEQRLKLLEQKEKEVQQRLQNEKSKNGTPQPKDW